MKYAIWDKQSTIYTPSGAKFTAEQWIAKHPIAENPKVTIICSEGDFNGGFFGTLSQLEDVYKNEIDFSVCTTAEEKVAAINAYMVAQEEASKNRMPEPTAEERIAAALEYQMIMSMPDVEEVE